MRRTKYSQRFLAVCLAALLMVAFGACNLFGGGGEASPAEEGGVTEEGYPVLAGGAELAERPERIISLAPAMTEKLCDLGAQDRLVGISDYCDYPESITGLRQCGTAQIPDLDAIRALSPQLVVTEAALPDEMATALRQEGIQVAAFPHAGSVDELMHAYKSLGRLLEGEGTGEELGQQTGDQLFQKLEELFQKLDAYTKSSGKRTVLYLRLPDSTVATGDTYEGELLRVLCMENLAESYTNWVLPEAARTAEGVSELAAVDAIFLDRDFVTVEELEKNELYGELPAVVNGRCHYISSIVLERQSLRTVETLEQMAAAVYPEAIGGAPVSSESPSADSEETEPETDGEASEADDDHEEGQTARD